MSDGGEGLLDVLGGANRTTLVTGPLGTPVEAAWRLDHRTAVIEMARASGLVLAGGAEGNDPLPATTAGTGELIDRASIRAPGVSSSASAGRRRPTAGSAPSMRCAARPACAPSSSRWRATCAPGSSTRRRCSPRRRAPAPAQVGLLTARLEQLARRYRDEFGVDVTELDGAGAAGGLAGGLAALGGRIVGGFDLVAEHVELEERIAAADVVVTGEGYLDAQSLEGKVVGGVCELAAAAGRRRS